SYKSWHRNNTSKPKARVWPLEKYRPQDVEREIQRGYALSVFRIRDSGRTLVNDDQRFVRLPLDVPPPSGFTWLPLAVVLATTADGKKARAVTLLANGLALGTKLELQGPGQGKAVPVVVAGVLDNELILESRGGRRMVRGATAVHRVAVKKSKP